MEPFTYHLHHIPTDQHYYGVRYKNECRASDLWITYFSSSPIVHQLIEQYGKESFVPSVRKIFETAEEAVEWESKFLSKVDAQHNDKWLNRHNGKDNFMGPHKHSEKSKKQIASKMKGRKFSDETKELMSISAKEREAKRRADGWTMPEEAREKQSAYGKTRVWSKERNAKMSASKKGTKRQYLDDGSFIMIRP